MDTLLHRGDHRRDSRGLPIAVTGTEELLQRAMIRLTVPRGAFPQDPELGSRLRRLRSAGSARMEQELLGMVQEALYPMEELTVTGLSHRWDPENQRLTLRVELLCRDCRETLEVTL